jgi:hypothetical protein
MGYVSLELDTYNKVYMPDNKMTYPILYVHYVSFNKGKMCLVRIANIE